MDSLQSHSEIDYNIFEDENEFFLNHINPMSKPQKTNKNIMQKDNYLKYMEFILYCIIVIAILITIIYFVSLSFQ